MTDECESDLVSAILMWLIIVVGIINICAVSLFLVASVVTYMSDEDSYPYMDGITINNKPDTKIYCEGEMVIRINDPDAYVRLTPGKTYTINCRSHDCLISEENVSQYEYRLSSESSQDTRYDNIPIRASPTHHGAEPPKLIDLNQYI